MGFNLIGSSGPWNLRELEQAHRKAIRDHKAMEQEALRIAGAHAVEHVRARSTFKRRKANSLKDNTKTRVIRSSGGRIIKLQLSWNKPYASFVEYGTRAHDIPKPPPMPAGRYLRFRVKGGAIVFAKQVRHPGTRPYKFGWKAAHSAHRVLGDRLLEGMARVSRRF